VLNPQGLEEFGGSDGSYGGQRIKGLAYQPLRRVVRACAEVADAVIATDRALEPLVLQHLGVEPSRLRLVPNGIDVAACDALADRTAGARVRGAAQLAKDQIVLLSVGRLERNKGFHHLAEALAGWRGRADWQWVIAGSGPYRRTIEQAIHRAGIERRVRWLGRLEDHELHAWYEAADVFVHPTVYEGSSLVTLEAMTHRRPVVASRAGGLPDKVQPGVTGWLVPPGDPTALTQALDEAVQRRKDWPAMGAAGRILVESTFDWTVVGGALVRVYNELLAVSAAGPR
jgi:glycosyltransferase involved in cell wall biosynthesis